MMLKEADIWIWGAWAQHQSMPCTGAFRLGTGDIVIWCSLTSNGLPKPLQQQQCNHSLFGSHHEATPLLQANGASQ